MKGCYGAAAAGGLFRDDTGKWLGGFTVNLGKCSAILAELWGAWYALTLAWDRRYQRVILELDSAVVVKWLVERNVHINSHYSLLKDIFRLLDLDWEVKVCHTLREGNRGADALANIGINFPIGLHLFENAPPEVHEIILQDVAGVSFGRLCM